MEPSRALQNPGANAETFLHADEVDEPPPQPEDFPTSKRHTIPETDASNAPPLDTVEQQDIVADEIHQTSLIDERSSPAEVTQVTSPEGLKPTQYQDGTQLPEDGTRLLPDHWNINPSVGTLTQTGGAPRRPPLKRDSSTPSIAENNAQKAEVLRGVPPRPEQQQDASQDQEAVADSLSLGQLRKLVSEMPKTQQSSYAFDYADSAGFAEELEELFEYTPEERQQLMRTQDTFVRRWISFKQAADTAYQEGKVDWAAETEKTKIDFLKKLEEELLGADASERQSALDCAVYIALGCWIESSKPMGGVQQDSQAKGAYQFAAAQLSMIEQNVNVLFEVIGFETFYKVMQNTYATNEDEEDQGTSPNASAGSSSGLGVKQERWCSFVILYIMADHARRKDNDKMRRHLRALDPPLLGFLMRAMIKARWDDEEFVPPTKLLLLCWKAMLLVFGGTAEVTDIKRALGPESPSSEDDDQPVIQASPLDYHVFRQEIISKYPAFDPPPALFPFESDSTSFVPPLQDHPSRSNSITFAASEAGPANIQPYETPIMQQPVHIATPAPSPPPSPAGPGKAIKKQNYQTNQNFPFLYPPLDSSSNDLGGKGSTELQDLWAGRKWQGRDIPHSILEAADLFSSRMRATRPMKQLWEERVKFLRFERGHEDVDELNLDGCVRGKDKKQKELGADLEMQKLSEEQRARLEAVGDFYADMLPKLQSLVIVLLKVLLQAVTTIITQPLSAESLQKAAGDADDERSLKPLMAMRSQEITGKAVSAIILLMLKWSKLSHILRFEYLSQLLLDNQYIQLILKLFTHQELERVVNHKCEREGLNFFAWCRTQSRHQALSPSDSGEDKPPESGFSDSSVSPDEAVPPPIRRAREPADNTLPESVPPVPQTAPPAPPPEVDELGLPTNAAPAKPITNFNWRVFFTSINHLRILQKLLKAKPHRQLLMVQSKYSLTLKKNLKVPQDLIRLYTLKIIKGQVPYCHRKWRQGNMRIITAIYLHVKPSLREDWLAGLDIEQEVNEALPMEQALRAMTNWWHSKTYPEQMGIPAAASTGPELMSEYMKRLNAVAEEKDAQMVDEILGPAEEDIVDDVVTEANPEAKVPPATETSPSSMRAPDVEATPRPPKFREISPTFDIDYDPFTSSGRGDTTTGGDPTRDGLSDFISSAGRSRSRPSSRPSSRQGSRRPSLKDKLLGDPGPDNDFFLRELEKMDLSGRLSSANSSEADAADINERNAEVERGNARAAMANGAVSVTPLNADGSADQRPSGGEVRYGAMEVKGVNGSLTNGNVVGNPAAHAPILPSTTYEKNSPIIRQPDQFADTNGANSVADEDDFFKTADAR